MGRRKSSFQRPVAVAALLVFLTAIVTSVHLLSLSTTGAKTRRQTATTELAAPPAPESARGPNQPPRRATECAGTPGSGRPNYASLDACGYPSPDTAGVPAGARLARSSRITASRPGRVISGLAVSGTIVVKASDVTIENTEVSASGNFGIVIESGVTGTVIEDVTIHGTDATATGELQYGIDNEGTNIAAVTADHVAFYNGERILNGPGTLTNSFCLDNVNNPDAHYECVYEGSGSVTLDHNTLLTAHGQTAAIYLSTDFGPLGTVKVTNNLLAGGGYALYADADRGSVSSETVTGNRFSRLYYRRGGYYGPVAYLPASFTWSDNIWDKTGRRVAP